MKVKKRTLLILASIVWLIAGFNIYSNWNTRAIRACDSCEYFALSAGFCCILVDGIFSTGNETSRANSKLRG